MRKRVLTALLALSLAAGLVLPALAAAPSSDQAAQVVNALGIMVGDERGDMGLSRQVTRAEFVTMAIKATPGGEQVGQAALSPYPDVPRSHWASGYVEAGVAAGLVSGYTDGTFRPSNPITLAEGAAILLQLLGYGPSDFSGAYPTGQLAMYRSLKLDRGVSASAPGDVLTRQDAMYLFYNLMTARNKEGTPYLETLGHKLNSAGEIDLVALVNDAMEGPVLAQGDWKSAIPFSLSGASVYLEGKTSSLSEVAEGDAVYWNRAMNALWVYRDRLTGTIQALEPSSAAPTSVTVAGRVCPIETASAAYALSDLGGTSLGDTVTLVLGRGGAVVAVAVPGQGGSTTAPERVGLVTAVETASYPDGKGGSYEARTAVILATDGQTYRYQVPAGMKEGSLVRISPSQEAQGVTVRTISSASLSGKVDETGTKVGKYTFAQGAEILDVSDGVGVRIPAGRLAGLTLSESQVRYYALNSRGEIGQMILTDVTGDMYQYGLLTQMEEMGGGEFSSYYSYTFLVDGTQGSIPQTTTRYPVSLGGIRLKGTVQSPEKLYSLQSVSGGQVKDGAFVASRETHTLAEDLSVYELRGGTYYLSTLERVKGGDFLLTGWYDKDDDQGGRLRVIVARER